MREYRRALLLTMPVILDLEPTFVADRDGLGIFWFSRLGAGEADIPNCLTNLYHYFHANYITCNAIAIMLAVGACQSYHKAGGWSVGGIGDVYHHS
jgi:hypothetical protein